MTGAFQGCLRAGQEENRFSQSTETATAGVVSDVSTAADSNFPTVLLSLDISAGFALDHNQLLPRANDCLGFDGIVLDWVRSYLAEARVVCRNR